MDLNHKYKINICIIISFNTINYFYEIICSDSNISNSKNLGYNRSMIATRNFDLGPFQIDDKCVAFYDDNGRIILESYAYENNFFRFNWHSSLEIIIVLKGRLKTCTERGMFDLEEDGVLIINPNIETAISRNNISLQEGTVFQGTIDIPENNPATPSPYAEIFNNPDSVRQAFICSEILNRKYQ